MLTPAELLIGKTVLIDGKPVTVNKIEHLSNFVSVLVNGSYRVSYAEFERLAHSDSVSVAPEAAPTPAEKPAEEAAPSEEDA